MTRTCANCAKPVPEYLQSEHCTIACHLAGPNVQALVEHVNRLESELQVKREIISGLCDRLSIAETRCAELRQIVHRLKGE